MGCKYAIYKHKTGGSWNWRPQSYVKILISPWEPMVWGTPIFSHPMWVENTPFSSHSCCGTCSSITKIPFQYVNKEIPQMARTHPTLTCRAMSGTWTLRPLCASWEGKRTPRIIGKIQQGTCREAAWWSAYVLAKSWSKSGWWWLEPWNFMTFHSVGNVIIPTDFHIFQRGRAKNH